MSEAQAARDAAWRDALRAAAALALAPRLLGGAHVRSGPGPVREAWLQVLKSLLPASAPWRRIPAHISESRLIGGLDLAATLRAGRPVAERGLLAECSGGIAVLAMAERASAATLAQLRAALDHGEIRLAREGISATAPAGIALLALDESLEDEDGLAPSLADRLALHVDLRRLGIADLTGAPWQRERLDGLREGLTAIALPAESLAALARAASALGVDAMRPLLLESALARVSAALDGRGEPDTADLQFAARMALAPHATRLPEAANPPPEESAPPPEQEGQGEEQGEMEKGALEDRVLEAVTAALPADLLSRLGREAPRRGTARSAGTAGAMRRSQHRGRPAGVLPGDPRRGARLALVATLRAAAPWQPLRRREQHAHEDRTRVLVRREDFRVTRFRQPAETTTIFVVDASGSSALHRLAEAKGAVELLLA
ncbi:MAG: magnesium chelatase ATPase subunit D, partial [Gammaproteobacteria bacterium]